MSQFPSGGLRPYGPYPERSFDSLGVLIEAGPVFAGPDVQGESSIGQPSQAFDQFIIGVSQHPWVANHDLLSAPGFAIGDELDEISKFLFVSWWCVHQFLGNQIRRRASIIQIMPWVSRPQYSSRCSRTRRRSASATIKGG